MKTDFRKQIYKILKNIKENQEIKNDILLPMFKF